MEAADGFSGKESILRNPDKESQMLQILHGGTQL